MNYSDIVATVSLVGTVIGIPSSGYLSYYYAIKGERRKEWNALVKRYMQIIREVKSSQASQKLGPEAAMLATQILELIRIK